MSKKNDKKTEKSSGRLTADQQKALISECSRLMKDAGIHFILGATVIESFPDGTDKHTTGHCVAGNISTLTVLNRITSIEIKKEITQMIVQSTLENGDGVSRAADAVVETEAHVKRGSAEIAMMLKKAGDHIAATAVARAMQ